MENISLVEKNVNVVVVGYPKSGNTWITRLTAELLNAPVVGFWARNDYKEEIAVEGLNRDSMYKCYKSHHQLKELRQESDFPEKIIYVIRDPRDVVFSGMSYFTNVVTLLNFASNTKLVKVINRLYQNTHSYKRKTKNEMLKAVLEGNKKVHNWCKVSWKDHLEPYKELDNILIVKYEDALADPLSVGRRILEYVGVDHLDDANIKKAVFQQSFLKKKQDFKEKQSTSNVKFLRTGGTEYWRTGLNEEEKKRFYIIEELLLELGYAI